MILDSLKKKIPSQTALIQSLESLLSSISVRTFSAEELFGYLNCPDRFVLAHILYEAIKLELCDTFIVINFTLGGELQRFNHIDEVPEEIFDWRAKNWLKICPEHVKVYYKFNVDN